MSEFESASEVPQWGARAETALQVVAALGHITVREAPTVLGDPRLIRAGLREGALILDGGDLWPHSVKAAKAALTSMEPAARYRLHGRLSKMVSSEFVAAQQRDLAQAPGNDAAMAEELEVIALRAERLGLTETALDLWTRAVARTPSTSVDRFDREMRVAQRAQDVGDFEKAHAILGALRFESMTREQSLAAVYALGKTLYQLAGVEMARLRLSQRRDALPAGHPSRIIFDVYLAGLHDHYGIARSELETIIPVLRSGHYPAGLEYIALSMLVEAKVSAGQGLDPALLEKMRILAPDVPDLPLNEGADATEAYLAHQTGDASLTRRLIPALLVKAEAAGDAAYQDVLHIHAALADTSLGQFASARRHLAQDARLGINKAGSPAAVRAHGLLALELGDGAAFRKAVAEPHSAGREPAGSFSRAGLQGIFLARSGEPEEAVGYMRECLRASSRIGIDEPGRRMWIEVELGLASAHLGDLSTARDMAAALETLATRTGRQMPGLQSKRLFAWVAHYEGQLDRKLELVRQIVGSAPAFDWLPEKGRIMLDVLDLLDGVEDTPKVVDKAWRGVGLILGLIEDGVVRRELQKRTDTRELTVFAGLTAAEQRVTRAIAQGMSNVEASEALGISPRTVESHLGSIYRKLDVRSRSQLVALVTTHGLG